MAAFQGMHVCLRNIAMHDYQESVTTGQTRIDMIKTPDKVIPMCCYVWQATQQDCRNPQCCDFTTSLTYCPNLHVRYQSGTDRRVHATQQRTSRPVAAFHRGMERSAPQ